MRRDSLGISTNGTEQEDCPTSAFKFARTVMLLLIHQNEVLLLFHKDHKKWMGPGGHIDSGELDHEAAQRELLEETGLVVNLTCTQVNNRATVLPTPFRVHSYRGPSSLELDYTFVANVDAKIRSTPLVAVEQHNMCWIDIAVAIESFDMYEDTRQQLQQILDEKVTS